MDPKPNYYNILNTPRNSSEEEIKKAYRKLIIKYHPDKNRDSEEIFRNIVEAYEILVNPQTRLEYDRKLGFSDTPPARVRRGTDITLSLKITAEDIANEATKNIITSRLVHCKNCNGTGCTTKTLTHCHVCGGSGIDVVSTIMGPPKFCSLCRGYGNYSESKDCGICGGTGLVTENINRQIKIFRDFQPSITIPGSGNYPIGNNNTGNLVVLLNIEKPNKFEIHGKDIKGHLKISPSQAVLGDILFIDMFGDPVKVVIPPGTKDGSVIEKENCGISKGNKKGSLILKISIDIPKKVSDEEKKLYIQLLKIQKGYL